MLCSGLVGGIEARFAWKAALVTAEDDVAGRSRPRLPAGLNAHQRRALTAPREIAPAKLNLALHVRGKLPDGQHAIETIFAFCTDGDWLSAEDRRRVDAGDQWALRGGAGRA